VFVLRIWQLLGVNETLLCTVGHFTIVVQHCNSGVNIFCPMTVASEPAKRPMRISA
jgi:hypothetical protein